MLQKCTCCRYQIFSNQSRMESRAGQGWRSCEAVVELQQPWITQARHAEDDWTWKNDKNRSDGKSANRG